MGSFEVSTGVEYYPVPYGILCPRAVVRADAIFTRMVGLYSGSGLEFRRLALSFRDWHEQVSSFGIVEGRKVELGSASRDEAAPFTLGGNGSTVFHNAL